MAGTNHTSMKVALKIVQFRACSMLGARDVVKVNLQKQDRKNYIVLYRSEKQKKNIRKIHQQKEPSSFKGKFFLRTE